MTGNSKTPEATSRMIHTQTDIGLDKNTIEEILSFARDMEVILNDRRKVCHVMPVINSDNKDAPQVSMKKTLRLSIWYAFSNARNPGSITKTEKETTAVKQLEAIRPRSNVATAG